jgi:hypothetical protein
VLASCRGSWWTGLSHSSCRGEASSWFYILVARLTVSGSATYSACQGPANPSCRCVLCMQTYMPVAVVIFSLTLTLLIKPSPFPITIPVTSLSPPPCCLTDHHLPHACCLPLLPPAPSHPHHTPIQPLPPPTGV